MWGSFVAASAAIVADDNTDGSKPIPLRDPPAFSVQSAPFDPSDDGARAPRAVQPAKPARSPPPRRVSRGESFVDAAPQDLLDESDPAPLMPVVEATPSRNRVSLDPAEARTEAARANIVTAQPTILIETSTPAEINVGKTAKFIITVRNLGTAAADQLEVRTALPEHAELIQSTPKPAIGEGGELRYQIGSLPPKASRQIELQLVPRHRGPIDLQASAAFSVSTRTALQVRRPQLVLSCKAPETANFGETVTFDLELANIGDGTADQVVLTPQLPRAAIVNGETDRPLQIGFVAPGQKKRIPLSAKAIAAGLLDATFTATDSSGSEVSAGGKIRIYRATLEVAVNGPRLNFLHRDGVYEVTVTNPGDAPARNVTVVCSLPASMELKVLDRDAAFDPSKNTLTLRLPKLDASASESLLFKASADAEGEQLQQVMAQADGGLAAEVQHLTMVISRPNLNVKVINRDGPLDVNSAAQFEIELENVGTKTATDVSVRVLTSEALHAIASDEYSTQDGALQFPTLSLAIGEKRTLRFQTLGREPGDHIVRVILESSSFTRQLAVEGSAFFYDSQSFGAGIQTAAPNRLQMNH